MSDVFLANDEYLIYLRKSRADNPHESVEEVLQKHESMLQEKAERELGGRIPEKCIYREVVSGETIDERPQMLAVLAQIENPALKGVLVVEPQRLSRGDLEDCGRLVNAFRYSKTEVMTLNMDYDLTNKMQRKFFEQELMRGNDYLEYTKEILMRGRIAAVKRGCYIGNIAPFGYDKVTNSDGDCTLEPNDDAAAVQMAFDMYVNQGKTYLQIARYFDSIGIKPMRSEIWEKCSIRAMLANRHYIGMVVFGSKKTEKVVSGGQVVTRRSRPGDAENLIIAKGKHPAIISQELFDAAQEKMDNNPRAKQGFPLQNPFAGLMICQKCGKMMAQHSYPRARTRIECRNRNGCGSKSAALDDVVEAAAHVLELEHLPEMESRLQNDNWKAAAIQQKQLEKMNVELDELYKKDARQHDFLEDGTYTKDVFVKRNKQLMLQIDELKTKIFEAKQSIPKEIDYADKIVKIKEAIKALRDTTMSAEQKNKLLKAIVERIEYEFVAHEGKGKVRFKLHVFLRM